MDKKDNKKELLLDSNPFETRLAINEDGVLKEFYVEKKKDRGISGNVYKGRVARVLPGMQAAFLELGLERTAFLHVSDVMPTSSKLKDCDDMECDDKGPRRHGDDVKIQDLIKKGDEVMVQVAKEPIGTKGARVTSYVSLPGRYLVLMPTYSKIGVSRRIGDEKERRRLKSIVSSLKPEGCGFIVRTVCAGKQKQEILADMEFLLKLWKRTLKKRKESPNPSILYEEPDLTLRTIRDVFSKDFESFTIEPRAEYDKAIEFVDEVMPELSSRMHCYDEEEALFDVQGIEVELTAALDKKVWLPSGGFLVMDQMEALTAIDVNTGKYVGKKNSEHTILKTNLESVDEVVHQLKLRNIGGIIVIDFIDMESMENREKVYRSLREALKSDKARTNILKVSELGLIEMTRKRTRESLSQSLLEDCPYCDGNGLVKAKDTVAADIYRDLVREYTIKRRKRKTLLYVNPVIAEILSERGGVVELLKKNYSAKIIIKPIDVFHQEEYEIV